MKTTNIARKIAAAGVGAVLLLSSLALINGYGAVAFAAEPELLWERRYDAGIKDDFDGDVAHDVAVDKDNNIIITGMSNSDYYTIKYDSNGNQLWNQRYNSGFNDKAFGVATDSKNNVIVTGIGGLRNGHPSYYTIKSDSNGNQLWADNVGTGESANAYDVTVDSNDNIIVTGHFLNYSAEQGNHFDFLTLKYDPNGRRLWHKIYNKGEDMAFGVAIDSKDNVIVTGVSNGDFLTIKYDANGNELWSRTLDNGSSDTGFSVAVDNLDNIIVVGSSYNSGNKTYYTFLIKYDSSGRELWRKSYQDASRNNTLSVKVDSLNNIIVAKGGNFGKNSSYNIVAYDPDGEDLLWERSYDGGGSDMANGVAVDSMDNVIVTGGSHNDQNYDYVTLKYGYPIIIAPLLSFTATPTSGEAPLTVRFTDTSTNNPTSWLWDFGDGATSAQQNPSHTYNTAGTYAVSLTVSNTAGSHTKTIPNYITVTPPDITSPAVIITQPLDGDVLKDTITIKASASDDRGVNRVEFYIDNTLRSADNTFTYEYSWDTKTVIDGAHAIKAQAHDDAGNSSEDNITIKVQNTPPPVNHPPVLAPIGNQSIDEGKELRFTVSATDRDGDTLTYSAGNLPFGSSFEPSTRVFSWTPDSSQSGTYPSIHFEVSDGKLIVFEDITITVKDVVIPVNHPPVAKAGPDQVTESGKIVQLDGSASFDPDGDILSYQWTQVSGTAVSLQNANQAMASFSATEVISEQTLEFQLTVTDPGNLSDTDTTIITVKPKPEIQPIIQITQPQDNSIVAPRSKIIITANVQDPDNTVKNVSFLINNKTHRARKDNQGTYHYNWSVPYGYSQTYNIKAQAKDRQRNIVANDSITVSSSSTPRVSLTNPQNNQIVLPRTTIPITVSLSPDNIGITKVEFYINNQKKHTDRNPPYSYHWRVPKEVNQTYNIQVKAFTRDEEARTDVLVGEDEVTVRTQ